MRGLRGLYSLSYGILCAAVLVNGCAINRTKVNELRDAFSVSEDDLSALRRRTMVGDANAAWELHKYYAYQHGDNDMAELWLKQSAYLGHLGAREYFELQRFSLSDEEYEKLYPGFSRVICAPFDPFDLSPATPTSPSALTPGSGNAP